MGRPAIRWWQWLTVLSLDAPLVALAWQALLARNAGVVLGTASRFVLGSSVWLAYAGDRWFGGWRIAPENVRTPRQWLYQRWRWPVAALGIAVLAADLAVALRFLPARDFRAGLWLLGPVLAYLLSHQIVHRTAPWRLPKEICVALLFGGGAAVFVLPEAPGTFRLLAAPLGWFTAVCFANCALISAWEHEVDESHGETSLTRQFRGAAAFIRALPWALAVGAAGAWLVGRPAVRPALLCASASAVLLGAVDRLEPRLGRQSARVLADVVLLTPFIALLAGP